MLTGISVLIYSDVSENKYAWKFSLEEKIVCQLKKNKPSTTSY